MRKIKPTARFGSPDQLSQWIKSEKNAKLANRLNAVRLALLDYPIKDIATTCDVSMRTIEHWISKWNQSGKEGLVSKSGGSKSKVTASMRADITEVVEITKEINGKKVTGKLICGYLKKTTN